MFVAFLTSAIIAILQRAPLFERFSSALFYPILVERLVFLVVFQDMPGDKRRAVFQAALSSRNPARFRKVCIARAFLRHQRPQNPCSSSFRAFFSGRNRCSPPHGSSRNSKRKSAGKSLFPFFHSVEHLLQRFCGDFLYQNADGDDHAD